MILRIIENLVIRDEASGFSKKSPRRSLDNTVKKIKIESLNVEVMVQQALECRG